MEIKTDTVSSLGSNKLTFANTLPKMSFLPQCFFDKVIDHDLIILNHFWYVGSSKLLGPSWVWPDDLLQWEEQKGNKVHLKNCSKQTDFIQDYEENLRSTHGIPPSNVYKYPKCRHFKQVNLPKCQDWISRTINSQVPTDSGICHTFNGVGLSKILKPSSWFSAFRSQLKRILKFTTWDNDFSS